MCLCWLSLSRKHILDIFSYCFCLSFAFYFSPNSPAVWWSVWYVSNADHEPEQSVTSTEEKEKDIPCHSAVHKNSKTIQFTSTTAMQYNHPIDVYTNDGRTNDSDVVCVVCVFFIFGCLIIYSSFVLVSFSRTLRTMQQMIALQLRSKLNEQKHSLIIPSSLIYQYIQHVLKSIAAFAVVLRSCCCIWHRWAAIWIFRKGTMTRTLSSQERVCAYRIPIF